MLGSVLVVARPAIRVVIFGTGVSCSLPVAVTVASVTLLSVAIIGIAVGYNYAQS